MPLIKQTGARPNSRINNDRIKRDIVVIGASAGGVIALQQLFAAFPLDLPAAVGVVLHRNREKGHLAEALGRRSTLPVIEPEETAALKPGHIYLAPADHHLLFYTGWVAIYRGRKEHSARPAVDPLFRSAAAAYGRRVIGVLLTGCGEDGVSGLIAISKAEGLSLVQDPDEAYMPYLPLNALRQGGVDRMFRLGELASAIVALTAGQAIESAAKKIA